MGEVMEPQETASQAKISRRQRLDDEHRDLRDEDGSILASYGSSLITMIFNVNTLVDATLFFISGGHRRYVFKPLESDPDVIDVRFVNPRIPSFFTHLLPQDVEEDTKPPARRPRSVAEAPAASSKKKRSGQRARKRCAFFTVQITRNARPSSEPVHLSADVKLFHYTAHVCGLRDVDDARIVTRFIHAAFIENQKQLDATHMPLIAVEGFTEASCVAHLDLMAGGSSERRAFLESNHHCCTQPLTVSEGDVVMTNLCGRFPKTINLRATFRSLMANYPGVLAYLTTMSKSNYLVITLFEHAPFEPILTREEMLSTGGEELIEDVKMQRRSYLMANKRVRSKHRKHTFFIYASGRFIQSSRNNATALSYTARCMKLLHTVSATIPSPTLIDDDPESGVADGESDGEISELEIDE